MKQLYSKTREMIKTRLYCLYECGDELNTCLTNTHRIAWRVHVVSPPIPHCLFDLALWLQCRCAAIQQIWAHWIEALLDASHVPACCVAALMCQDQHLKTRTSPLTMN